MSEIFHQFLTGGWKANSAFEYGKFLSVGKRSFLTNQKLAKPISQFMLKNHDAMLRSATFHQSVTGGF